MTLIPVTAEWLGTLETLKDVPADQLQWLIDNSRHYEMKKNTFFIKPGDEIDGPHVIIQGRMDMYTVMDGIRREMFGPGPGDITGYLPYSRATTAGVFVEIAEDLQVMTLPKALCREMIRRHFELTQALVHIMNNRIREFSAIQQQNEKMLALGKLSAGLAHELNNPAAAIVRDAVSLKEHLTLVPERFREIMAIQMEPAQVDAVSRDFFPLIRHRKHQQMSLQERMKAEEDLGDWFEAHDVGNNYDLAETFVEFHVCIADLERIGAHIPPKFMSPIFNWLHSNLVIEKMVEDIEESSSRISNLVSSVKVFTHMDRDQGKAMSDIHPGIRNTLTILGFKIRHGNIKVVEDYDPKIPLANVMVGELNQVWTNLFDNALDAMEVNGKGTLTIKTRLDNDNIEITVSDDGPGIPEAVRSRIFDPFFTTKEVGKGTGMGLEVVQRIIRQHHGSVKVNSSPAGTEFVVCLPISG